MQASCDKYIVLSTVSCGRCVHPSLHAMFIFGGLIRSGVFTEDMVLYDLDLLDPALVEVRNQRGEVSVCSFECFVSSVTCLFTDYFNANQGDAFLLR